MAIIFFNISIINLAVGAFFNILTLIFNRIRTSYKIFNIMIVLIFAFFMASLVTSCIGGCLKIHAKNKIEKADDLYKDIHLGLKDDSDLDKAHLIIILDEMQTNLDKYGKKSDYYNYIDDYPWLGLHI